MGAGVTLALPQGEGRVKGVLPAGGSLQRRLQDVFENEVDLLLFGLRLPVPLIRVVSGQAPAAVQC